MARFKEVMSGGGVFMQAKDEKDERHMRHRLGARRASIGTDSTEKHSRRPDIPQVANRAQQIESCHLQGDKFRMIHAVIIANVAR
jgi:hypothetical protein